MCHKGRLLIYDRTGVERHIHNPLQRAVQIKTAIAFDHGFANAGGPVLGKLCKCCATVYLRRVLCVITPVQICAKALHKLWRQAARHRDQIVAIGLGPLGAPFLVAKRVSDPRVDRFGGLDHRGRVLGRPDH